MQLAVLRIGPEHLGAKHRYEGKGGGGGDNHNDAHNPSELLEHNSHHTLHQSKRQEYAEHSQR